MRFPMELNTLMSGKRQKLNQDWLEDEYTFSFLTFSRRTRGYPKNSRGRCRHAIRRFWDLVKSAIRLIIHILFNEEGIYSWVFTGKVGANEESTLEEYGTSIVCRFKGPPPQKTLKYFLNFFLKSFSCGLTFFCSKPYDDKFAN